MLSLHPQEVISLSRPAARRISVDLKTANCTVCNCKSNMIGHGHGPIFVEGNCGVAANPGDRLHRRPMGLQGALLVDRRQPKCKQTI